MVRLILGRAGTGKTARVFEEIRSLVARGENGTVFLVPEQYSHEAERELCAAAGDSLSLYAEVLSFTGLASKVFAELGGVRPVMDEGGRLLCMAVAAGETADGLKIYGRCRKDPNLLGGLLAATDEMRRAGVSSEGLMEAVTKSGGVLGDKLADLALLSEAFAAAEAKSAADPADVLETLAGRIGDSVVTRGRFYLDGFTDFTALEKNVVRALIAAGTELTVCLTCSGEADDEVFALSRRTARWLTATAREYGRECCEEWMESAENASPIRFFSDHLFAFDAGQAQENDGAVTLVKASDVYEECELAAARMRELARGGSRWRDMAVAVRGFSDYRTALECACETYGVPLFLAGRGDILRRSVPLLIRSALGAVTHGYEYEDVFGVLKTGLAGLAPEECDELENYCILWGVRGGMWNREWSMHPEGYNRAFDDAAQNKLAELNEKRLRVIGPLKTLERAGKTASTAREQAEALGAFLMELAMPERLGKRADQLAEAGRPETAAETRKLWDIVCAALEQFAAVLGGMPMDQEEFSALFSLMLSKYDVGLIPVSLDRVQAGEMDAMRRRHIRHLFVLGATDGRLPAPAAAGGVFSDEERQELSDLGVPLDSAEDGLSRELGVIYNCLSLPSDTLYISRPATDGEGGETRPSVVTERAKALLGLEEARGDILEARTGAREPARGLAVLAGAGNTNPACLAARDYFAGSGEGERISRLSETAKSRRDGLCLASVRALYGAKPRLSATRAEKFNACRFGYFLQYGLHAKPRQKAVFDPRDYGTFMHFVLEQVAHGAMERGGFAKVSRRDVEELADRAVDEYVRTSLNDFAEKSKRFVYLFRRLRATVRQVCADMWEELSASKFTPIDLELDLTAEGVLEPVGDEDIRLTGRADRVDGWVKDGTLYLRITDYKTGVKKFSLSDVCQGMDLQMLLYLFTLQKRGGGHFGAEKIVPAGVLYAPARFDILRADSDMTDEELAALRRTSARRSGLVLQDEDVVEAMEPGPEKRFIPVKFKKDGALSGDSLATLERFGALDRYIDKTLAALAAELRAGSVEADPWFKNARDNACQFCEYREACLFDESSDCVRVLTNLKTPEAWDRIEGK
jgi:ATP-dependent helicase/nuclease subunit B